MIRHLSISLAFLFSSFSFTAYSQDCVNGLLTLNSNMGDGGPSFSAWNLVDVNQQFIANGMAQFSVNDPTYTYEFCIVPGCYGFILDGNFANVPAGSFTASFVINGQEMAPETLQLFEGFFAFTFCFEAPVVECPTEIFVAQPSCNVFNFEIGSASPGENVVWNFGDGDNVNGGHFASHTFLEDGVYLVNAYYSSDLCPDIIHLVVTVVVEGCFPAAECPTAIDVVQYNCLSYGFEIGSASPGESVTWNFGDGNQQTGGLFIQHDFESNGVFVVNAFYTSNACPDGVYLVYTVLVENCFGNDNCPTSIDSYAADCNSFTFSTIGGAIGSNVVWHFGDESNETGSNFADHSYSANGVYTVTAFFTGAGCTNGVELTTTVELNCNTEIQCPTAINFNSPTCGLFNFEIDSATPGENVYWNFGDGIIMNGGHFISHYYEVPGVYIINAFYISTACPNGVNLILTVVVENCNPLSCPEVIWATQQGENCDHWDFEMGGFVEGENVIWYFDGQPITGGHFIDYTFETFGEHQVCAFYTSPNCPDGVELCTSVLVNENCQPMDCAITIAAVNLGNGLWEFTASGSPEVYPMHWTFGDGTELDATWVVQHQYTAGLYEICGFVNTPFCPEPVGDCAGIEVINTDCTEIIFGMDSFVELQGPVYVTWSLVSTNGTAIATGTNQYSSQDPYSDSAVCLNDGCYYLVICGNAPLNTENFHLSLTDPASVVSFEFINTSECIGLTALISVNGDCGVSANCTAAFNPILTNTPGQIEFSNQSNYDGSPSFFWSYGDGQFSDGVGGSVLYNANGTYLVCLTVTTDNCVDTYCQEVTVTNMDAGCQANTVSIAISGEYPNAELSDLIQVVLIANGIEFNADQIELSSNLNFEGTFCLPDGCYTVAFNAIAPIIAQSLTMSLIVNGETIDVASLLQGEQNGEITFGLNSECALGVNAISQKEDWSIFPNPSNEHLLLSLDNAKNMNEYEVFDASGRILFRDRIQSSRTMINISSLENGCYLIRMIGNSSVSAKSFIVSH